jgi:hypothetical protein
MSISLIKSIEDGEWVFDLDQAYCRDGEIIILSDRFIFY